MEVPSTFLPYPLTSLKEQNVANCHSTMIWSRCWNNPGPTLKASALSTSIFWDLFCGVEMFDVPS